MIEYMSDLRLNIQGLSWKEKLVSQSHHKVHLAL